MQVESFISKQVIEIENQILAYQSAALDLAQNKVQSFTFNTGQTSETVTKANIVQLQQVIDALYNRYIILSNRLSGNNIIIVRPAW